MCKANWHQQFWKLVVFVQSSALGSLADAETRVLKGLLRTASGPSFIIIRSTFSWVCCKLVFPFIWIRLRKIQLAKSLRVTAGSRLFIMIQSSSAESAACSDHLHDLWYCRDSAWDLCLDIVYQVCSQMLFDFLNKVAQGTQLDFTSLELPKVRSDSDLAWSSKIWDLTLKTDPMIESAL